LGRAELKMQAHICDSYELYDGYACKWDAAHAKGKPDLVCAFPLLGAHFVEVKHRPKIDIENLGAIKNPLEKRQVAEAGKIWRGGGVVIGGLVIGGLASVQHALLGYFHPLQEVWYLSDAKWVPWQKRGKFHIPTLITDWRSRYAR